MAICAAPRLPSAAAAAGLMRAHGMQPGCQRPEGECSCSCSRSCGVRAPGASGGGRGRAAGEQGRAGVTPLVEDSRAFCLELAEGCLCAAIVCFSGPCVHVAHDMQSSLVHVHSPQAARSSCCSWPDEQAWHETRSRRSARLAQMQLQGRMRSPCCKSAWRRPRPRCTRARASRCSAKRFA